MPHAPDLIVKQLTSVVDDLKHCTNSNGILSAYDARRIATRASAAIVRFAPSGSAYLADANEIAHEENVGDAWRAEQFAAIVHALRDDYSLGGLLAVEEIVHADLFDDFLSMSAELLGKGFIGPSAVLAGSVLEEHVRKLAGKHGIGTADDKGRAKSVETLGVELRKGGAVTEVQRKSVTAWYAQRTEGAHGRSENLYGTEVERMIDGVRDFIARHPA